MVGGSLSNSTNFDPVYDQEYEFNLNTTEGGLLLYEAPASSLDLTSIPIDLVVYGENNTAGYLDPTGVISPVHTASAGVNVSLRRTGPTTWEPADPATPNDCPPL